MARFGRCSNYPREKEGVQFLAQGLAKAADATGVEMQAIVDRCAELSQFCPTDYDLLTVASEMKAQRRAQEEAKRNKIAEWERECGPPQPFDLKAELTGEQIMENGRIAREKRKQMLAVMRKEWERTNPGSRKDWTKMSQQAWMRLQIWAQEQVGIAVTPEQRREVNDHFYQPEPSA